MPQKNLADLDPDDHLAVFRNASDGDVVTVAPAAFLACARLTKSIPTLTPEEEAYWRDNSRRQRHVGRQVSSVACAVVGEAVYMLDGSKRAVAWTGGVASPPDALIVAVHHCETLKEARALHRKYREKGDIDYSRAQILSAYDKLGLNLSSTRLKHGEIAQALYLAFRGSYISDKKHGFDAPLNLGAAVECVAAELQFLDSIGCPTRVFFTGVLAMGLIGVGLDDAAKPFLEKIAKKAGNKRDGYMDPVDAVVFLTTMCEMMDRSRSIQFQPELFKRSLRGLVAWLDHENDGVRYGPQAGESRYWFKGKLREIDAAPLIADFRARKGIAGRRDL
ncbi:MAG: hypothetical protein AAFR28_00155 [Pseudomonadota bacterium]